MLDARLVVRVGDLDLDLDLHVEDGETVALLGPNGAGKSTTLRALAGLRPLDDGWIRLDGTTLDDPGAGTFVETASRPIGMVFQDYLLFPRLSALDNVAFGLRARGRHRHEAREAARTWLDRFDLTARAGAMPRTLSGGEAQRVALARALATEPRLLLLDEPLAALDASTRPQVRAQLRRHLAGFDGARIVVTHDPVDAISLADRLVVVEAGRAVQVGTPADLAARPASRYVADLVGVNLVHGARRDDHTVTVGDAALTVADRLPPGEQVALTVRPQAVALHAHQPEGSPRNVWSSVVEDVEVVGERARVRLGPPVPLTAEVTTDAVAALGLAPGLRVWASVKAVDVAAEPD